MTLSSLIINYRKQHNLSQREFAKKCNLSNGYISMLEKNINPNTELPILPSIEKLLLLAGGLNISLHELLLTVDDISVLLGDNPLNSTKDTNIIRIAGRDGSYIEKKLTDDQLDLFKKMIDQMPDAEDL